MHVIHLVHTNHYIARPHIFELVCSQTPLTWPPLQFSTNKLNKFIQMSQASESYMPYYRTILQINKAVNHHLSEA